MSSPKHYSVFKLAVRNHSMTPRLPKIKTNLSVEINPYLEQQQSQTKQISRKKPRRKHQSKPFFNRSHCLESFEFLHKTSQQLLASNNPQPYVYLVLAKEYFDFFKGNHPEINSRLLMVLAIDSEDQKYQLSFKEFELIDKLAHHAVSIEEQIQLVWNIFAVGTTFNMDINEFILVFKLIFNRKVANQTTKESIYEKLIRLLKSENIVNRKRHLVSLTDFRNLMAKQPNTFAFLFGLIFH